MIIGFGFDLYSPAPCWTYQCADDYILRIQWLDRNRFQSSCVPLVLPRYSIPSVHSNDGHVPRYEGSVRAFITMLSFTRHPCYLHALPF